MAAVVVEDKSELNVGGCRNRGIAAIVKSAKDGEQEFINCSVVGLHASIRNNRTIVYTLCSLDR